MRIIKWLGRYWYIPIIAVTGIIAFILGIRRSPFESTQVEIKAIDAGEKIRLEAIDHGAQRAREIIETEYDQTINALNARQRKRFEDLVNDPVRRVRFLERVSSKRRGASNSQSPERPTGAI